MSAGIKESTRAAIAKARALCIDWNGQQMVDGEAPRDGLTVIELRVLAALAEGHTNQLALLERCYTVLGDFRHNWPGRHTLEGQALLVDLRETIAVLTDRDPQEVQDDYCVRVAEAEAAARAKGGEA